MVRAGMAQYGEEADDLLMRELGYRQMILQTYDAHETGVSKENIVGGAIVISGWLNIAPQRQLTFSGEIGNAFFAGTGGLPSLNRERNITCNVWTMTSIYYHCVMK